MALAKFSLHVLNLFPRSSPILQGIRNATSLSFAWLHGLTLTCQRLLCTLLYIKYLWAQTQLPHLNPVPPSLSLSLSVSPSCFLHPFIQL